MDKKKIIIIAVVAVLLYILYKRGTFDSLLGNNSSTSTDTTGGSSSTGSFSVDTNDTDSIIGGTSMTSAMQTECKGFVRHIEQSVNANSNGWNRASLVKQAEDNDITYQQQLVISSLWQMYKTKGSITLKQYNTFREEVLGM